MFQFKKRVNSLSLSSTQTDTYNNALTLLQEKHGECNSINEVFALLMQLAVSPATDSTAENDRLLSEVERLTAENTALKESTPEPTELATTVVDLLGDRYADKDPVIILRAAQTDLNTIFERNLDLKEQVSACNEEINSLRAENEELKNIDLEIPEATPFTPDPQDIYIQLSQDQRTILTTIANNRFNKQKDPKLLSHSELAQMMVFNRGNLYNWHGEIYTGLG